MLALFSLAYLHDATAVHLVDAGMGAGLGRISWITRPPGPMMARCSWATSKVTMRGRGFCVLTGLVQRLQHLVQDVQPTLAGLLQCLCEHLVRQPPTFMSIWGGGDALWPCRSP